MKPTNAAPPGEPTILSSSSPSSKSSSIGTTPPRRRAKAKAEVAAALPPWNSSSLSAATKAESFSIFDSAPSPELITSRAIPFFLQICSDSHQIILFFELVNMVVKIWWIKLRLTENLLGMIDIEGKDLEAHLAGTRRAFMGSMVEESSSSSADNIQPRNYWRWSKQDFFPEESFQSWANYKCAIKQTKSRFKDRFISRSDDAKELGEVRKQSENDMKKCLNWWDLIWFGFGSVIGAGIFVLTGQEAHNHAGPAIVLSYVASGLSAMLSVFCYTEFAVEIPVAGGSFAYLRVELGDFAAFIAAGNIFLETALGNAAVARSWTSYFATLINLQPDSLRIHTNLSKGYNLLDPIASAVIVVGYTIAIAGTRRTSQLNWIASAINTVVIIFVIVAGFSHAKTSNLSPFLPHGAEGVFKAAAIVYFAYGGFDNIATMAEETRNPSRDIPLGLLGSMSLITVIYCLMALSLSMMQKYTDIDPNAAYSVAFQSVGMKWAKYLVALGALKGMTTVILVGALGQARYITHIARAHMIPPWFSLVHPTTGTPIYATLLIMISGSCLAFFTGLDVLSNLLAISTLFIFMMLSVAVLVRRYYARGITPKGDALKLVIFIMTIIASSMGTSAYWGLRPNGWKGYTITIPLWFLATLGISAFLTQQRTPKVWGVPLVPWLPSLSIATNLFLMGSLGAQAFIRFGICTVVMLIYYLFVGLHATYDLAHQQQSRNKILQDDKEANTDNLEDGARKPNTT